MTRRVKEAMMPRNDLRELDEPGARAAGGSLALGLCCAALAALAPGCDDTDPAWELNNDRIIAVRVTPPQLAPGERAVLDVLVTSPQGGPRVMTPLAAVAVPDSVEQPLPPALAGSVQLQGISWTVTAPDAGALGALRAERELTESEPLLLRVGVRVDPGNGPLDAVKTVRLGQRGDNPALGAVTIDGEPARDDLVIPADSDVALQVAAAEGQEVFWLTSIGELDDADDAQATLRHDRAGDHPLAGHVAVVVRDGDGGVVWGIWRASIAE